MLNPDGFVFTVTDVESVRFTVVALSLVTDTPPADALSAPEDAVTENVPAGSGMVE